MPLNPKTYTFLCGCFAALGSILFGYDLGIIAAVLPAPDFLWTMYRTETQESQNDTLEGFITSILLLGAFCGTIPSSYLADRYGRRLAILVGSLVFILGGSLQTAANGHEMMLAGRFFAGFAIGMLSMLAPLYQSEIAHPSIRGRLTTLQQLFLGLGSFIASFVGYGCTKNQLGSQFQWRFPLGLQIAPAVPLAAMIFLFPESPRWYAMVGRREEALDALARLHASGNKEDVFVQAELAEIIQQVEEEALLSQNAFQQIFTNPQNMRKVALGVVLQFSAQMTGVSVIQYYSPVIFKAIGFETEMTLLLQSCNSVLAIIGEICCILFVDKLGRRNPLIIANFLSSCTFCVATAIQAIYPAGTTKNNAAGGAFVAMTWIFNFLFSSCIGPLTWAYPVEIMNTGIRARGTALTSLSAWAGNFMIAQVTPVAFRNIGWKYYLIFAICGFTNALTMWLFFPETKGIPLESMDEYFEKTHWIVPLSTYKPILTQTGAEEQLRQGIAARAHMPRDRDIEMGHSSSLNSGDQTDVKDSSKSTAVIDQIEDVDGKGSQ